MKKICLSIIILSCVALGNNQFDCSKRYCKEMASCAEAYHYLNKCGLTRLDRDGDGVPCENVCGGGKKKRK